MTGSMTVTGRLVLDDRVESGLLVVEDGRIAEIKPGPGRKGEAGPYLAPGFVDVHVHGWGGHDAMDGPPALDDMARQLLRHGVTSFLPTAVSAPMADLVGFADRVRAWIPEAPADGAEPLGFNLEGPFLSPAQCGAHDPDALRTPAEIDEAAIEPLVDGLRLITIAPELAGALELIARLRSRGATVSLGHSAASLEQARAGFAAGATTTTHLFNAMSGVGHHAPGLALAALLDDAAWVELIADGQHVDPVLWELIGRLKPASRLVLVSDAIAPAGIGNGRARLGGLEVEVVGDRATLAGTTTLAGSVIALDAAVRNLVAGGFTLPAAAAAASRNPLAMLGVTDRGRFAVGQRADLVELDDELMVRRVLRNGRWLEGAG